MCRAILDKLRLALMAAASSFQSFQMPDVSQLMSAMIEAIDHICNDAIPR
jgi:hypothetical protein